MFVSKYFDAYPSRQRRPYFHVASLWHLVLLVWGLLKVQLHARGQGGRSLTSTRSQDSTDSGLEQSREGIGVETSDGRPWVWVWEAEIHRQDMQQREKKPVTWAEELEDAEENSGEKK